MAIATGQAASAQISPSRLGQALTGPALAHGYDTALWWIAGIFAGGAVIGGTLLRRGHWSKARPSRQTTG